MRSQQINRYLPGLVRCCTCRSRVDPPLPRLVVHVHVEAITTVLEATWIVSVVTESGASSASSDEIQVPGDQVLDTSSPLGYVCIKTGVRWSH